MTDSARNGQFLEQRIAEKQVHEAIGIARGLIADGHLNDAEIAFLHRWLVASEASYANPMLDLLIRRIEAVLEDGVVDDDERADLTATLQSFTANDFELGELLKATTLPVCNPAPIMDFGGARMCFTGTFTFGKRRECEAIVSERGALPGSLTQKTKYLVIGEYATDAWKHSAFGNKIMQAVEWRSAGVPIHIVTEQHWRKHLI